MAMLSKHLRAARYFELALRRGERPLLFAVRPQQSILLAGFVYSIRLYQDDYGHDRFSMQVDPYSGYDITNDNVFNGENTPEYQLVPEPGDLITWKYPEFEEVAFEVPDMGKTTTAWQFISDCSVLPHDLNKWVPTPV